MSENVLSQKTCVPCKGGIPPLTPEAVEGYLPNAPGWEAVEDGTKLEKHFSLKNFRTALDFVSEVGELAESEFHHPVSINFGWGFADIVLQTKKIKGLHENDFIMAAKINEIYRSVLGEGEE